MIILRSSARHRAGSIVDSVYVVTPESIPKPHNHYHTKKILRYSYVKTALKMVLGCQDDCPQELIQCFLRNFKCIVLGMGIKNSIRVIAPKVLHLLVSTRNYIEISTRSHKN